MDILHAPQEALSTGYNYLWTITDDYSRMQWSIGLKTKSIRAEWPKWRSMTKTQYGDLLDNVTIKHMKFDNAKEFLDSITQKSMEEEGILVDLTVAYAHNQNGVAERAFQDIVNHAVSILSEAGLPLSLWYEISLTVTYLRSVWPHNHPRGKIPFEIFHKRKPNLTHFRVFDSKAWIFILKEIRKHKFQARAVMGRLVGYKSTNQYRLWAPELNDIVWARDITIDEYDVVYQEVQPFQNDELGFLILD
jgi:hypothetical protein